MADTPARLLRLLSLLQTYRGWTGPQLAERLGVTTRTVRADVERLRALGYPVMATPGAAGGYRLGAGAAMPPLLLDDEEAVAIAVGLRTAAGAGVTGIEETSLRALAKLEQVLPDRLRRRVNAVQTHVESLSWGPHETVDPEALAVLSLACRDHEQARFDYADKAGAETSRLVEPHRLVSAGHRWYLVAYDVRRDDWRTFRVDRSQRVRLAGERFRPRPLPAAGAAEFVSRSLAASRTIAVSVVLHAPPDQVARLMPHPFGEITAAGRSRTRLTAEVERLDWVAARLAVLGVDFTVESPAELRSSLASAAERLARAAAST